VLGRLTQRAICRARRGCKSYALLGPGYVVLLPRVSLLGQSQQGGDVPTHSPFMDDFVRTRRGLQAALLAATVLACRADRTDRPVAANATGNTPASTAASDSGIMAQADAGRIRGSADAKVWVVEVSDFQCPYCKMWHDSTYPAIVKEYVESGKVRMAYVNFPLGNHQHAVPAAEAAMCASAQGKFWEMHSAIFDTQERWTPMGDARPVFDSLAKATGVAMPAWQLCMSSHATLPLIEADRDRGDASGVRSTPSFLIGNEAIAGAQPIETFRQVIERALRASGGTR
jgi:protein-disulfide isomerase